MRGQLQERRESDWPMKSPKPREAEQSDIAESEFIAVDEIMRTLVLSRSSAYAVMHALGPTRVVSTVSRTGTTGALRLARVRWNAYLDVLRAAPLPTVGPLVDGPDGELLVHGVRERNAAYYDAARAILLEMHQDFKAREDRKRIERAEGSEFEAKVLRRERQRVAAKARAVARRAAKALEDGA